ncbi:MAG: hypothetical protein GY778_00165, partial [bacterium]|nr:hypothetical protein [bacterium]
GVVGEYFTTGSAWSMTSNQVRSMNSANGWERWFVGWIVPQTATADGTFTLRDFITSGDALRVELPFPHGSGQYLWLENHQGSSNFDSRDQFLNNGVGDPLPASPRGVLAYVEAISDDHARFSIFGSGANGLRVIPADGDHDWSFPAAPVSPNPQEWWGKTIVYDFSRGPANPLAGQNETSAIRADFNGDGMIQHNIGTNTAPNEQHDVIMENGQFTYGPLGASLGWPAGFEAGM